MGRLLLGVLLVGILGSCDLLEQKETTYVVPTVLNVRKGPSTQHGIVTQVRRGQELTVVERQDPWVHVLLGDESPGWVHGNYVGTPTDVRKSLEKDLRKQQGSQVRRRVPKAAPTKSTSLSIDGLLADLPAEIPTEILPPLDGVARVMGAGREGQVVVEFWGPEDKLDRAMMMVTVRNVSEEEVEENARYALGFVKNALPGLKRDVSWMVQRLGEISSRDTGSGELQSKGRTVTFEFLKALGAVRVMVEENAEA